MNLQKYNIEHFLHTNHSIALLHDDPCNGMIHLAWYRQRVHCRLIGSVTDSKGFSAALILSVMKLASFKTRLKLPVWPMLFPFVINCSIEYEHERRIIMQFQDKSGFWKIATEKSTRVFANTRVRYRWAEFWNEPIEFSWLLNFLWSIAMCTQRINKLINHKRKPGESPSKDFNGRHKRPPANRTTSIFFSYHHRAFSTNTLMTAGHYYMRCFLIHAYHARCPFRSLSNHLFR